MPKPKPPTTVEIAAALGCSRTNVIRLVKLGMPTNSAAAAKKWRKANPTLRQPTNGPGAGQPAAPAGKEIPGAKMQHTDDPMMDVVVTTRVVHEMAFEMLTAAMANRRFSSLPTLIQAHNKAVEANTAAEKAYREELERRDVLVPKAVITEMCKNALNAMLKLLKKLPSETGPQCNDTDPLRATTILQKKTSEIIAAGQKALKGI